MGAPDRKSARNVRTPPESTASRGGVHSGRSISVFLIALHCSATQCTICIFRGSMWFTVVGVVGLGAPLGVPRGVHVGCAGSRKRFPGCVTRKRLRWTRTFSSYGARQGQVMVGGR